MADIITKSFKDFIVKQLSRKYKIMHFRQGEIPQAVDSFCPDLICRLTNESSSGQAYHSSISSNGEERVIRYFNRRDFVISEAFSNRFGIRKIQLETLVNVLGFEKKYIRDILVKISMRRLNIVYVGFGGTGVNTHYWLSELASWCNIQDIFKKAIVMDEDTIDFTNILRFPMDMNTYHQKSCKVRRGAIEPMYKTNLATDFAGIYTYGIQKINSRLSWNFRNDTLFEIGVNVDKPRNEKVSAKSDTIFYGAPDIPTREMLSDVIFIAATHGDNECSLHIRPKVDTQLQQESYGMIQLNAFFMNQLRMAIAFIELIAKDDFSEIVKQPDNEVFKFDFHHFFQLNKTKIENEFNINFCTVNATANREG